ncbi:MAG: DNA polymerase III subunit chi [Caedimonadaceae bacterium]|nr:MAG: DNA polymerase III subunit chi [Caedimonadaceae bacterium]
MTEISFYQLRGTPLERALPKLVEKIYAHQKRVVILADSEERLAELNTVLWTYSPGAFLPHGTKSDGNPEDQPIWLTTELENPNQSNILIVTDESVIDEIQQYEKILDFFNGLDADSLQKARSRWIHYKKQNLKLTYWEQTESGSWENKLI